MFIVRIDDVFYNLSQYTKLKYLPEGQHAKDSKGNVINAWDLERIELVLPDDETDTVYAGQAGFDELKTVLLNKSHGQIYDLNYR